MERGSLDPIGFRLTTRWSRPGQPGVTFGAILVLAGRAAHLEAVRRPPTLAMTELPLSGIPNELLASISDAIFRYSVVLLKVWFDPPGVDNILHVGAGTLVEAAGRHGIVTAYHVAREFSGECYLGLTTSTTGNDFKIHASQVDVSPFDSPADGEYGPDLAFISIGPRDRDEIAQVKEFYSLSAAKPGALDAPPPLDVGVWVACGSPHERSRLDPGDDRFDAIAAFQLFCGFGGVDNEFQHAGMDFLEMAIDSTEPPDSSLSLKGMSGGGLWQVPIALSPTRQLLPSRFLFSGVIFWRDSLPDGRLLLRSHGRRSIYEGLFRLP